MEREMKCGCNRSESLRWQRGRHHTECLQPATAIFQDSLLPTLHTAGRTCHEESHAYSIIIMGGRAVCQSADDRLLGHLLHGLYNRSWWCWEHELASPHFEMKSSRGGSKNGRRPTWGCSGIAKAC